MINGDAARVGATKHANKRDHAGKSVPVSVISGKNLKVLATCMLYMCIGPTLILVNKFLLKDAGFPYPMCLSSLGLVFTSLMSHALVRLGKVKLNHAETVANRKFWTRNVLPVGFMTSITLFCGNAVYLHLSVAFVQMLKAFTPVIVLAIAVLFKIERPPMKMVGTVLIICVGTCVASFGEVNFSLAGMMFMLCAELAEAGRLVLAQYLLQNLKFGVVEGQYYFAPASALCLLGVAAVHEMPTIYARGDYAVIGQHLHLFVLAGTLGLGVQYLSYLVICTTNATTLKVLGTARNAGLVMFAVVFRGEVVTTLQFLGYAVALLGFAGYNYVKIEESRMRAASSCETTAKSP